MSIHVCKCDHCGKDEYHLRYPGLNKEHAQEIANKINSGCLDQMPLAKQVSLLAARHESLRIIFLSLAATISCEQNGKASVADLRITMQPLFRDAISSAGMLEMDNLLIPPTYPPNDKDQPAGAK